MSASTGRDGSDATITNTTIAPTPQETAEMLVALCELDDLHQINELASQGRPLFLDRLVMSKTLRGWELMFGSSSGNSAFHVACWCADDVHLIERLLELGASIDFPNYWGQTPLHLASLRDRRDIVELLLNRGACVTLKNRFNSLPVHFSAAKGYESIVELFIAKGCNIQEQNARGNTPLHMASLSGKFETVGLLLTAGASLHLQDDIGRTARQIACSTKGGELERRKIDEIISRWPVTMLILVLQELFVYNQVDVTSIEDLWLYL